MNYWLSFDDYCPENIRIADFLKRNNLNATFFIEPDSKGDRFKPRGQMSVLHGWGFDIGSHTIDHRILTDGGETIDRDEVVLQLNYSKKFIEEITGKKCKTFCPPRGRYNDEVLDLAKEAGYKIIRSTKVLDTEPLKKGLNHTTVHCYQRKEFGGVDWWVVAKEKISEVAENGGCFKLWGHGWELEKFGYWDIFEDVLMNMKGKLC